MKMKKVGVGRVRSSRGWSGMGVELWGLVEGEGVG